MVGVIVGVVYVVVFIVAWIVVSRWGFRSYRSMLEMSIPARYAERTDPRSRFAKEFGAGTLNCSGRPFAVSLSVDSRDLYLVPHPHWTIHWGMPSYVIPISDIHGSDVHADSATLQLATGSVVLRRYRGLSPDDAITRGPDGSEPTEVVAKTHPLHSESVPHVVHIFTSLRIIAGLILIALGASAALAGHWEILIGFVIGGLLVLGALGRLIARAVNNPDHKRSTTQTSRATLAISGLTALIPLAIAGVLILVLSDNDGFLEVLAGVCLAAAFSLLVLYVGLWVTNSRLEPSRS